MFTLIIPLIRFKFVNLPIKSKYYHKQLPTQIVQALKLVKKQPDLNEKCFLLEHVSDLLSKDRKIRLTSQQKKFISQELNKWKNQSGRFQHIATVAWVIKKLNLQKLHEDLYEQIKQRFLNDEWYVNFDESIKALEVFKNLPQGQDKTYIMQRIQRNLGITMWNVNMKYYARIVTGLLQGGRYRSQLWERMEKEILENLGMQYETKTVCEIFKGYALSGNGDRVFYQMLERVLYQGHFTESRNLLGLKNVSSQHDDSGEFFSLVIQTYAIARKSCGVILTPEFKDYVYQGLMDRKTEYRSLSALTRTIRSLQGLEFEAVEIKQIQQILIQKKPVEISFPQVQEFYQLMEQRHGEIPAEIHLYIEGVVRKDIKNRCVSAGELVDFINRMLVRGQLKNHKQMIAQVNKYLESNFKYLYPQEAKYVIKAIEETKLLTKNETLLKLPEPEIKNIQYFN